MTAHHLEGLGIALVETMISRAGVLGRAVPDPLLRVLGPEFEYRASPELFGARTGAGPLRIALDTNLLIDYFDYGHSMWAGKPMAEMCAGEYGEHLEALQLILAVWVLRDIEFVMLAESLNDSKRGRLANARRRRSSKAWIEFTNALSHSPTGGETPETPLHPRHSPATIDTATASVPAGGDRRLVRAALADGAHVYLTRDKGVLRAASALRGWGLSPMTPGDLLEALSMYGALNFLWDPQSLYWPLPDQAKVVHLVRAIPGRRPLVLESGSTQ